MLIDLFLPKRIQVQRTIAIGLLAGLVFSVLGSSAAQAADQPNFIIVFTDDQGYNDLGCFGSQRIATPNIDQLAAEGRKFTSFYTACSVCSPSRAALLTGSYPKRVGMHRHVLFPKATTG